MECKRDQAVIFSSHASNYQERCNELAKIHHVPFPVVAPPSQMYPPPPPRPYLLQNMWLWNRYPPKVIQAAAFKNMQFVNGNFIPPCQPYRIEPMPGQLQPPPLHHYTQQKLLLKSGQLSQTIMEQLKDHFSHQVILQKMRVETPVATPQYYERKKEVQKATITMDYANKSCVTNVQLNTHPFIPYPGGKQEAIRPSCSAKRMGSALIQSQHPQTLKYSNKQQHILHQPLSCNKIRGSLPPQFRLQGRPGHQELVQATDNSRTSSNTRPRSVLPVLPHHRNKTHPVKVEQAKIKKAQAPKECVVREQNIQHYLKSSSPVVIKQKHAVKYNPWSAECQRSALLKTNALPSNQNIQCNREMLSSLQKERSNDSRAPLLLKTTEVAEGKSGMNSNFKFKKTNHASKLQKKYSRAHIVYGKTSCKKGNYKQRHNVARRKYELDNPLLRYCNLFKEDAILISQIPQEKANILYFLEAWVKLSLSKMKESNFKTKTQRHCKMDTFKISLALSKFLRAIKETPNGTKLVFDIVKILKQLKCFKLEMKKRNFMIINTQKSNKQRIKRNSGHTGHEPSSSNSSYCVDEKGKYSSRETLLTKRFRFINPLHSHFEIKSWSDKKIENQISAHYFHMIADSLLLDNLFKVTTEYGIVNLVDINYESITGWVHFKMALQEVFRNAANHLLNDSLVHAPIQSKLYFNSFLSHIYTNTDLGVD